MSYRANPDPDSKQYTWLLVDQNGIMRKSGLSETMVVGKLEKVSAFKSYRDRPLSVPIQILFRLSSTNPVIIPPLIAPLLLGSGIYVLNLAPSKRQSSPA